MSVESRKLAHSNSYTTIMTKAKEVRSSLSTMVGKVETGRPTHSDILDGFSTVSGQLSSFTKVINNEKGKEVQNSVIVPLVVSTEQDRQLEKLTEDRIHSMQHELIPDQLRTKMDLEIEKEEQRLQQLADQKEKETEIAKQIELHNEIIDLIGKDASHFKENMVDEELLEQCTKSLDKIANSKKETRSLLEIQTKGTYKGSGILK